MQAQINRKAARRRVRYGIRKKIEGTAARPRLAIFRSDKHIYAQAIDDHSGRTLASASTRDKDVRPSLSGKSGLEAAKLVGAAIAERLTGEGVSSVVFDRGGFIYHGRVKALADAAREAGLKF